MFLHYLVKLEITVAADISTYSYVVTSKRIHLARYEDTFIA